MTLKAAKMIAASIPDCHAFYFRTRTPEFDERFNIPVVEEFCIGDHPDVSHDEYGSVIFETGDYIFDPDPCHHYPFDPYGVCYTKGQQQEDSVPGYWCLHGRSGIGQVPKAFQQAAQRMLNDTWKQRKTRDRKDAMPKALRVLKVERNENVALFKRYQEAKQALKTKRCSGCSPVNELDDDPEHGFVKTVLSLTEPYEVVDRDAQYTDNGSEEPAIPKEQLGIATYTYKHYVEHLDKDINEVYLLHGTSIEGSSGICSEGFRLDLAGSHVGTMFGNGAYFAEASSKADEYVHAIEDTKFREFRAAEIYDCGDGIQIQVGDENAKDSDEPIFVMLLCRVVAGEVFRVTKSDHDAIQEALGSGKYDSVLGDREASVGTYREFVAFNERHIYPEYKIFYERVWPDDLPPAERRRNAAEEKNDA